MINQCFLPDHSSIHELSPVFGDEVAKIQFFHQRVKNQIEIILGKTYVLTEVLQAFNDFSSALASLINPNISFDSKQLKDKDLANKFDIYDQYFEVSRIQNMNLGQFIQQYLDTSSELVNELQYTSMSRGEVAYMLKGWEAANQLVLRMRQAPSQDFAKSKIVEAAPTENEERALYRWKLAHHGYALFMIFSAYCLDKVTKAIISNENEHYIADMLDKGAHLFRATTACMEFGNSFTAQVYRSVVRPDMSRANEEANLPNGFSGTQNLEFVKWRKSKAKMLKTVKDHRKELSPTVMDKLELFRTYYLEDMHIHSIIAGRMVGIEKSLLQTGFMNKGKAIPISAGDMLRMMAAKRVQETQFILEY